MLKITADIRSGLENPSWIITDETEIRALLTEASASPTVLGAPRPESGLGFRGIHIDAVEDDRPGQELAGYLATDDSAALSMLERLTGLIDRPDSILVDPDDTGVPELAGAALLELAVARDDARMTTADPAVVDETAEDPMAIAATCQIEVGQFNPGFWNNDAGVRSRNNCYNYASNRRTDTFAQPGRGSGRMYTAVTCPEVTRASLADGLHRRFDCFPPAEAPRNLVALVIAPGPFVDFHWYRLQQGGFWGHKPGGTAATNLDNSGRVITNPQTANRGPYTQFCGYFYTCRSQRIR